MRIFLVQDEAPQESADALRAGEIVCYPTETFYALGIDPFNDAAREKLYLAKGRLPEKDLPLIASDFQMVEDICETSDPRLGQFAEKFWPGPLTIVLPSKTGSNSFAVRVSSHPVARSLAESFGRPVVSTSANASGSPPIQDPRLLAQSIDSQVSILLDAGKCAGGAPSTIISLLDNPGRILREGAISAQELLSLL